MEFAEVFVAGGFDVVLANPPYVRQELIKEQKPRLKQVFDGLYSGTADLYTYFYARALQLLSESGMISFISSNKWFRAGYGEKLRKHIGTSCSIVSIMDFGSLPVFDAIAYPSIFIARRGVNSGTARVATITSLDPPYPDVAALLKVRGSAVPNKTFSEGEWRLGGSSANAFLEKMRMAGTPLGDLVKRQVFMGLKTGFNDAFIIDAATRSELISADKRSAELIRPLAQGKDIKRWYVNWRERYLIVTRIGTPIKEYPAIFAHLKQWKVELENRQDQGDHWWELRACAYYNAFERPKVLYQEIATYQCYAYHRKPLYVNNKVFFIPDASLFLCAVMNSSHVWRYLNETASKLVGGALALQTPYVFAVPIPAATRAQQEAVETLAQKCLDARGIGCETWEQEIDERVAALYGL